mmetsp:Transcript_31090/g.99431  ORF Transcript_31090/g.99431 Transcript_31090/m.99431 type:complete len:202 (+) Transcript_31090:146-751(+)
MSFDETKCALLVQRGEQLLSLRVPQRWRLWGRSGRRRHDGGLGGGGNLALKLHESEGGEARRGQLVLSALLLSPHHDLVERAHAGELRGWRDHGGKLREVRGVRLEARGDGARDPLGGHQGGLLTAASSRQRCGEWRVAEGGGADGGAYGGGRNGAGETHLGEGCLAVVAHDALHRKHCSELLGRESLPTSDRDCGRAAPR